jgi:hypothetical protein
MGLYFNMKPLTWAQHACLIEQYSIPLSHPFLSALDPEELQTAIDLYADRIILVKNFNIEPYGQLFGLVGINTVITTSKPENKGKIQLAFERLTETPVDLNQFAIDNDVSIHVLKQHSRFDKTGLGPIKIKKNNIWRVVD